MDSIQLDVAKISQMKDHKASILHGLSMIQFNFTSYEDIVNILNTPTISALFSEIITKPVNWIRAGVSHIFKYFDYVEYGLYGIIAILAIIVIYKMYTVLF